LTTNSPLAAPLVPGQRYYLGVLNSKTTQDATNFFALTVCPNGLDTNLIHVPTLTNGVTVTNVVSATNALDYYQYIASDRVNKLTFSVVPSGGNVDLVIRRARNVPDPLPTTDVYDYISAFPGATPEQITVDTNSVPVPALPGIWYIGVVNYETNAVPYTILVKEDDNPPTIITLTNRVPYSSVVSSNYSIDKYFKFVVTTNDDAVDV